MIYIGRPTWAPIKTLLLHVDEVGYWGHGEMIFHSWLEFLSNNKKIMVILCFPYPSPYGRTCRFSGLFIFRFFSYRLNGSTHHNMLVVITLPYFAFVIWDCRLCDNWDKKGPVLDLSLWFNVRKHLLNGASPLPSVLIATFYFFYLESCLVSQVSAEAILHWLWR